jgi:hypothetical protein
MSDKLLTDGLKKAKTATPEAPCHFVFVVKGSAAKLFVGLKKPAEKDVAEAKKATGGSVIRGICFQDGDHLIFQTPTAAQPAWVAVIKKLAKDQAALTISPEFRKKGEDDEAEGETTETEQTEGKPDGGKPDDKGAKFAAKLKEYSPLIKEAIAAKTAGGPEIGKLAKGSTDLANEKKLDEALAMLEKAHAMAQAALKAKPGPGGAAGSLGDWPKVREDVLGKLKTLTNEVKAEKHPESDKAILELSAVIKNITAEPRTAQQISELKKYLSEDDIVGDVCELAFDIRKPLLGALAKIQPA